jgi:hypothetical protein
MYNDDIYMATGEFRVGTGPGWYKVGGDEIRRLKEDYEGVYLGGYRTKSKGYKTGGLADFTGPAWLDGTPSKPEYVLNAAQTERFFSLVDILEGFDSKEKTTQQTGDNYFNIDINVDKLENDYDVEQLANKIRSMLYEDASYRNVHVINLIR